MCVVNWPRPRHLVRRRCSGCYEFSSLGLVETYVQIQWNPAYKAFHRIFVVETNQLFGSNPQVISMRQTCGQRSGMACGKQTPSFSILFIRMNLLNVPNIEM